MLYTKIFKKIFNNPSERRELRSFAPFDNRWLRIIFYALLFLLKVSPCAHPILIVDRIRTKVELVMTVLLRAMHKSFKIFIEFFWSVCADVLGMMPGVTSYNYEQ